MAPSFLLYLVANHSASDTLPSRRCSCVVYFSYIHIITDHSALLQVVEVEQPFDRVKNQRRAFIFITYESEEIVEQVVANPKQIVGGKEVRANS